MRGDVVGNAGAADPGAEFQQVRTSALAQPQFGVGRTVGDPEGAVGGDDLAHQVFLHLG